MSTAQLERAIARQFQWWHDGVSYSQSDAPVTDVHGVNYPARCCPEVSGVCDCSGCQCAAFRLEGLSLPKPCMVSGEMFAWASDNKLLLPVRDAYVRRGLWVGRGVGGKEHIAISTDNGGQFAAHSVALGLGPAPLGDPMHWSICCEVPGIDYTSAPGPVQPRPIEEETMAFMAREQGSKQVWVLCEESHTKFPLKDQAEVDNRQMLGLARGRHADGSIGEINDPEFFASYRTIAR